VVLDSNLQVKQANSSFYRVFHVKPEETEGRHIYDLGGGQWNIPKLKILLEEIIPKNNSFKDFEVEHEFPEIGRKFMILNATKVFHTQGEELILLAIEDVTEIKQAANQLAKKAEALSMSNRNLTDFAHVVSHDLQSPLNKIISFGDLLKMEIKSALNEKGTDYLDHIQNGAHKMGHLIKSLLDYSKVTTSNLELELVDMGVVAKEVLGDLDVEIKEAGVKVTVLKLPTVHASPIQMNQLITNLVGNAIKYCRNGAPVIDIAAKKEGNLWVFSVRDNGIGIDPKDSLRIFDLFQRVVTEGKPGTGIGLTICKKIVENYGGRIWVESEPGKGSTFFFTLPVK